jgi:hypothetical protein
MQDMTEFVRQMLADGVSPEAMKRPDGSWKGRGWLGQIRMPDGRDVMTEQSIDVDGVGEIPLLVPGMHPAQVNWLRENPEGPVPQSMIGQAVHHAIKMQERGRSPFR